MGFSRARRQETLSPGNKRQIQWPYDQCLRPRRGNAIYLQVVFAYRYSTGRDRQTERVRVRESRLLALPFAGWVFFSRVEPLPLGRSGSVENGKRG